MAVIDVKYVRCPNCSCVYSSELKDCPNCGSPTVINEDCNNEPVFNIND